MTTRDADTARTRSAILSRRDIALLIAIGGASLALYVRTLAPSVLSGDSAEIQVLVPELSPLHSPGHPIYVLLAHLFAMLPIGDVAYRLNLFSAVMAVIALALVYIVTKRLTARSSAAAFAALALAVCFTFWSQAVIAEVYTTGAADVALLSAALIASRTRDSAAAPLALAGFALGLGLGIDNLALFAPGTILFLCLAPAGRHARWRSALLPAAAGAAAGGAFALLALVLLDRHRAPANVFDAIYGVAASAWHLRPDDLQRPFERAWFLVSAAPWRFAMFQWSLLPGQAAQFVSELPLQFTVLTLGFFCAGLWRLGRRDRPFCLFVAASLLTNAIFFFTYRVGDVYAFYLPCYVLFAIVAGAGFAAAIDLLARHLSAGETATLVVALTIASIAPRLVNHWTAIEYGANPFSTIASYPLDASTAATAVAATDVVNELPRDAIVFLDWDELYVYAYAAQIAGARRDLRFVEAAPYADIAGLPASTVGFVEAHARAQPVFFAREWPELVSARIALTPIDIGPRTFYRATMDGR